MKVIEINRDEILQAAAHRNPDALQFLRVFARRAHWVDDLADEAPRPAFEHAEMEAEWLLTLSGNTFFLAHRAQLVPAMVLALNAWVDSHDFEPATQDVVKGQWHEVVWLVAWLTGGWKHLRMVTGEHRSYDFEPNAARPAERINGLPG